MGLKQIEHQVQRATGVCDIVNDQQTAVGNRLDVQQRFQQNRIRQGLRHVGVELDVNGVRELDAHGVAECTCRKKTTAGHGDNDLRLVARIDNLLCQFTGGDAEAFPGQNFLDVQVG